MIETVIVPLDGSVMAEVALPYAEELVARRVSNLILLFVKEPNDYRSENIIQAYLDSLAQKILKNAESYSGELKSAQSKVQTKILTGNPSEEIIKFADSLENSRIIMATHGQSGVGTRWSLGSVADKVSRATSRPITLIRAKRDRPAMHSKGLLQKILVPLDGSKHAEIVLPYVKDIAQLLKAEVIFLQVLSIQLVTYKMIEVPIPKEVQNAAKEYLEKLVEDFSKSGISAQYEIWETRGDVAGEIVEYTEKKYVDLVIMATHGHTGPRHWVMGSVTAKVLREGNAPITLIRSQSN